MIEENKVEIILTRKDKTLSELAKDIEEKLVIVKNKQGEYQFGVF